MKSSKCCWGEAAFYSMHLAAALRAVMADWREAWSDSDLPFLVVQLPGFGTWFGVRNCLST